MWPKGGPKKAEFSLPVTTQAFKKPPSSNNRALLDTKCTAISISNSPDSETMRNVLVLFVRYLVYDIVAKQHSQTKTESMLKNFTVWLLVLYYSITAFTKQTQWLSLFNTHSLSPFLGVREGSTAQGLNIVMKLLMGVSQMLFSSEAQL